MHIPRRMIILEGPDGGGKSYAAGLLSKEIPDSQVFHHDSYPGEARIFFNFLKTMDDPDIVPILDRSWISESIYSRVVRPDEPERISPREYQALERIAILRGAILINCIPSWDTVFATWSSRRDDEYVKDDNRMAEIYNQYVAVHQYTTLKRVDFNRDTISDPALISFIAHGIFRL